MTRSPTVVLLHGAHGGPAGPDHMVGSHARARTFARKGTIMAHAPQIFDFNSDIPLFDGFPYLVTRVSPGLYHIMLLPARVPHECQKLLIRQVEANRLDSCLVLGRRSGVMPHPTAALHAATGHRAVVSS